MAGKLIVVAGPSGSGKTTIAHAVLAANPEIRFSVSATTRPQRANETEGRDYFFLSHDEFTKRVEAGEFVEWEEVFGNLYGTLRSEVDAKVAIGRPILFDVDVKGALSIKKQYPNALLLFIMPPSMAVLERRLRGRRTEDDATVARRLERAAMEMELARQFDRIVINDDIERAVAVAKGIVESYIHSEE